MGSRFTLSRIKRNLPALWDRFFDVLSTRFLMNTLISSHRIISVQNFNIARYAMLAIFITVSNDLSVVR